MILFSIGMLTGAIALAVIFVFFCITQAMKGMEENMGDDMDMDNH